jgi:hypothetical protein
VTPEKSYNHCFIKVEHFCHPHNFPLFLCTKSPHVGHYLRDLQPVIWFISAILPLLECYVHRMILYVAFCVFCEIHSCFLMDLKFSSFKLYNINLFNIGTKIHLVFSLILQGVALWIFHKCLWCALSQFTPPLNSQADWCTFELFFSFKYLYLNIHICTWVFPWTFLSILGRNSWEEFLTYIYNIYKYI